MNGTGEAIYNPATGDYSVPDSGGGINVGVGALPSLPTIGGSYSADGTGSASTDISQWITTLTGVGTSIYRAVSGQPPTPGVIPGAARVPVQGSLTTTTAAQKAGIGTIFVILFVAFLVFLGVRSRR